MSFSQENLDRKVDDVEERVRKHIECWSGFVDIPTQAYKLSRHLGKYDPSRSDELTLREFDSAMIGLNFVGTQKEIIHLFERYDIKGTGKMPYKDFCSLLFGIIPNPKRNMEYRFSIGRFRDEIFRCGGPFGIRNLRYLLKSLDVHKDGKLLKDVILRGIKENGYVISELDGKVIMNCFDKERNGVISISEFVEVCRNNIRYTRRLIIDKLYEKLSSQGAITVDLLKSYYQGTIEFDEYIRSWMLKSNLISKDEFMDYYFDISGMILNDEEFESFINQTWIIPN